MQYSNLMNHDYLINDSLYSFYRIYNHIHLCTHHGKPIQLGGSVLQPQIDYLSP